MSKFLLWIVIAALACVCLFSKQGGAHPFHPTLPMLLLGAVAALIIVWMALKVVLRVLCVCVALAAIAAAVFYFCRG